jgi:hypothetical protein
MGMLALVLLSTATRYDYHRDELYFRLLEPAWGYVDQPPLTPVMVELATALLGDTLLPVRLVAIVLAVLSLPILALITTEMGGGRLAVVLTLWGMAGATLTLQFGHVLLTASVDLVFWPALLLCVLRALRREDGRWWLVAGMVAGLATYNRLLIAVPLLGVAMGIALLGPRRWLRSGYVWAGVGLVLLVSSPNLLYQATHEWPQFTMGAALGQNNAGEVRVMMWPFLVLLVGPVLTWFWGHAVVALWRRPDWRPVRSLLVVFVMVIVFEFAAGAQFYYASGILAVLVAVGAVPVAESAGEQVGEKEGMRTATASARRGLAGALALNTAGCAVMVLPLAPVPSTPVSVVAGINTATADQIGWGAYTAQVEEAAEEADADAVITSNYGEAGALDRYGEHLPSVHSGHIALWERGGPAADADTIVMVGGQGENVTGYFEECTLAAELDNGVDVDNEEQGEPILVCAGPKAPWSELWPHFRHLD